MQAFYSLIRIVPNTVIGDTISIGLLLYQENKYWLKISEKKKTIAKNLIYDNPESVDFVVKKITQYINKTNAENSNKSLEFFPKIGILNSDYFTYLSTYCNGVLQFSNPSNLNDEINKDKFEKLFSLLIDNTTQELYKTKGNITENFFYTIHEKLITKVDTQIHTKININASILPSMYFQYEIDCIGKNGSIVGAKSIPFDRQHRSLDQDISHYIALISLLSTEYKQQDITKNYFYVIADEPDSVNSQEHKTWSDIQKNSLFKVIPSENSGEVATKVIESGAKRFLNTPLEEAEDAPF